MRLRRARTILIYWKRGKLVFENFRTKTAITAVPLTTQILDFFDRWRQPEQLFLAMPQYSRTSVRAALEELTKYTLLVKEGSSDARQDSLLARVWSAWLPHGSFHFGSKDVRFAVDDRRKPRLRPGLAKAKQPPFFKTYRDAHRLTLPPRPFPGSEFPRVLLRRKTYREFSTSQLPLDAVSSLLFYTWGVMGYLSTSFGRLPQKTSPSGGARHPGEVYLMALRVEALPPGLYHYNPRRHTLAQLCTGEMESKAVEYCAGQAFVSQAGALFLMTAVLPRSIWKYRFARAYRVVLLDAGHLCQTFCLTATWLGLAPFCTAALKDSLIEKDLGIDGISEVVLYVAGVGNMRRQFRSNFRMHSGGATAS